MAEEKAEANESSPAAAPKSKSSILLYIMLFINMAVIVGVGFLIYSSKKKPADEHKLDQVIEGEHQAQSEESKKTEEFLGTMVPLEMFLVNLSGAEGSRLLKVVLELEVDNDKVQEEIEKRKPQIRDIIIIILSSKTYGIVSSQEGKESLREEIRDTLNSFLTRGKVKRVLFTEFILN